MPRVQVSVLMLLILASYSGEAGSATPCPNGGCDATEDSLLLQSRAEIAEKAKSDQAEDEEEGEEEAGGDEDATEAPETGGGGSHWDFLDEEHQDFDDMEHPDEEQHLGGIAGVVREVVEGLVEPLGQQLEQMSGKVETMQTEMQELHGADDTAQQIQDSLTPIQEKVQDISTKVDEQETQRSELSETVQGVADSLQALDGLSDSVASRATAEDLENTKNALEGSIQSHEQDVANGLNSVYRKVNDNGKVVKKIYRDIHHGAR